MRNGRWRPTSAWPSCRRSAAATTRSRPPAVMMKWPNRGWVYPALTHQITDPAGQHSGLARTGAGHYEHRTALMKHCLPLRPVQSVEQLFGGQSSWPGLCRTRHSRSSSRRRSASLPRRFVITQPTLDVSNDCHMTTCGAYSPWRQRSVALQAPPTISLGHCSGASC